MAYLPVMEHRQGEGLSLCMRAEVRLEAKRVDGRDEGLDGVEGGAGDRGVLGHMSSVATKSSRPHQNPIQQYENFFLSIYLRCIGKVLESK